MKHNLYSILHVVIIDLARYKKNDLLFSKIVSISQALVRKELRNQLRLHKSCTELLNQEQFKQVEYKHHSNVRILKYDHDDRVFLFLWLQNLEKSKDLIIELRLLIFINCQSFNLLHLLVYFLNLLVFL